MLTFRISELFNCFPSRNIEGDEFVRPIKVVQYGTWKYTHAEHTMQTMLSLPQYYNVAGICETHPDRLEAAMKRQCYKGLKIYTPEEIIADHSIDAVIVESAEVEQAEDTLKFLKAGFHVHSDKPCGSSDVVFREVVKIASERKLVFQNGYMYRYNPAVVRALEIVRSGKLGELISVELQMSQCYHGVMRSWLGEIPGGMMFYLGCHLVDLTELFMGEPEKVLTLSMNSGLEPTGLDSGMAMLKYRHGWSMIKTVANEVSGDARRQFVISGTKGTIEIKPLENPVELPGVVSANKIAMSVTTPGHPTAFNDRPEVISFPPYGRYDAMMIDFAKTVAGEKENNFDYERELRVHKLLTKICRGE